MNTDLMFSSASNEWATPQDFFDKLNKEFDFTLDPCSTHENHKCEKYFTQEEDGLKQKWGGKEFFATHHMGEQSRTGLKKLQKKQKIQIPQWLC